MSSNPTQNLNSLLHEWYSINQEKKVLMQRDKEYRKKVLEYMNNNNLLLLNHTEYIVKQSTSNQTRILKKNCPENIWNQYATEYQYNNCIIKKK